VGQETVDREEGNMTRESDFTFVKKHPILARAILIIGSLIITVLVIDLVAFYLLGVRRLGYGPERFFQYSSLLGWEHRPFAEGTWYAYKDGTRTHVRINAYGFPDAERTVAKNRPRIALVGDSTTEFWEVDESERAQRVMERLLDGKVEVLNFGLRGAGTDQELIRYTNQVVHFSPDIVVLFFCVNDLNNNVTTEFKPYFVLDSEAPAGIRHEGTPIRGAQPTEGPWLPSVLEQSYTLRQLKYLTEGFGTRLHANEPLETHFELRPFKRAYDADDERRLELEKRLIAAFANYSRDHKIHFLLVEGLYRPALDETMRQLVVDIYGDQFDFDRISRVLSEHSAVTGYDFLSLPRLVRERGMDVRALMHPEDTMHLNAEGVRVFSAAVVEKIQALRWLADVKQATATAVR
jgi:lysophospholipase L1-like esterase